MLRNSFAIALTLSAMLTAVTGCKDLGYAPSDAPIVFGGVRALVQTKEGAYIVNWDKPDQTSANVQMFRIYVYEMPASTPAPAALALQDDVAVVTDGSLPGTTRGIVVDLPPLDDTQLGTVYAEVPNDTTYSIPSLSPGNYSIRVRAVGVDGAEDQNIKSVLLTVTSAATFAGLETAEYIEGNIKLTWQPFISTLKGEPIRYIVYESTLEDTMVFADRQKLAFVVADDAGVVKTEFSLPTDKKAPGSVWQYAVHVVDPVGKEDTNVTVKPVTIPNDSVEYDGCKSGEALGATEIKLKFDYPPKAEKVEILRDGSLVYTATSSEKSEFVDRGVVEGQKYEYVCVATRLGVPKTGKKKVVVATKSSNPPTFAGIASATVKGDSVVATWGVTTGVPAAYFHVFSAVGASVNWAATFTDDGKIDVANLSTTLSGFGDELPYSFGVRAYSSAGYPDLNTVQIKIVMPDAGPPKTKGITAVAVENGKLKITAPWTDKDGAVKKRRIFVKTGTSGADNIANYTAKKTIVVDDLLKVPTTGDVLFLDDLIENTTYNVFIEDEDPKGNKTKTFNHMAVASGDLNAPVFAGISALTLGADGQKETTLTAKFTAIARQSDDPAGASHYQIYLKAGGGNSCTSGTFQSEVSSGAIDAGLVYPITITGLQPRTVYSVCLKARDAAGNVSKTDSFLAKSTIDTTPPVFDGVQGMTYNQETGKMTLVWNSSPSADILEYRVKLWKANAIPDPLDISTLARPHTTASTGFNFSAIDYPFGSNDKVFAVVNACDNANIIPGGQQNCTDFVLTSALNVTLADIDPPPGFAGIGSENDLTSSVEGTVNVAWLAPVDWTDYRSFKIYLVDRTTYELTLKSVYTCANNNCAVEQPTSAEVTNLDPFRTYLFHVRAADAAGNVTILDPITKSTPKRVIDTSAPTFSSNLTAEYQKGSGMTELAWSAATDNQYAQEPGAVIVYNVYRKVGSTYANSLNPAADGDLLQAIEGTVLQDNKNYVSGETYFYTVCAVDGTGNANCDGVVKPVTTPDLVPPTITSFTTTKTLTDKVWALNWTATDNTPGNLIYKIRKLTSPENFGPGPIDDTAPTIFSRVNEYTMPNIGGPQNTNVYITYQLSVEDSSGNVARSTLTLLSKNYIKINAVKASEGPITGGSIVLLEGVGLHSSTSVKLGGSTCTGGQYISETLFLCRAPSHPVGLVDVDATNSDGSSSSLGDAYSYCTTNSCQSICGNPSSWGPRFAAGIGTSTSPYLICNVVQLKNITAYSGNGKYIELKDNIDLAAYSANDFPPLRTNANLHFYAHLNGNGYVVANWKYVAPALSNGTGLIGRVIGGYDVKNLGVVNVDVKGYDNVGAIAGFADGSASHMENVFSTGKVEATHSNAGGITGYAQASIIGAYSSASVIAATHAGGIAGQKYYTAANIYSTGNVTVNADRSYTEDCSAGGLFGRWDNGLGNTVVGAYATGDVICLKNRSDYYNYCVGGLVGCGSAIIFKDSWASGKIEGNHQTGGLVGGGSIGFDGSYFTGQVTARGSSHIGGLIGEWGGAYEIINSHTSGKVIANGNYVGGLVGHAGGGTKITDSYSTANVVNTADVTGGLVGQADSGVTVKNVYAKGNVNGRSQTGGLFGRMHVTTLEGSYATGNVTGTSTYTGGIVGYMNGGDMSVKTSYATGQVNGVDLVGGFCGECNTGNLGVMQTSYATGAVTGNSVVGGFGGRMYAGTGLYEYVDLYATGSVLALGDSVGGFMGEIRSDSGSPFEIKRCYATGRVQGRNQTGGFVGYIYYQYFKVESSYSTGDVIGSQNVGGFVGYNNWGYFSDLHDNYSTGNVKGEANIGGFAGYTANTIRRNYSTGRVSQKVVGIGTMGGFTAAVRIDGTHGFTTLNNYFDKDTAGVTSNVNGVAKTSAEMRSQDTYVNFDFTSVWKAIPSGGGYPKLIWQP